jgi:hypothetical protein
VNYLAVKDFATFQHYRDRNPPWIKLYGAVLSDVKFLQLPEAAQAQLVKLWILASQMGNPLPNNQKLLAGRIGVIGKFHLAAIIASGFLIPCDENASTDASDTLAERLRPRARAESELEVEDVVDEERAAVPEPALTALYLTIWSNGAVTERWGESIHPYIQVNAVELAEQLSKLGVAWHVARLSIYRQCRESKQPKPPRTQNYFRSGIEADWQSELSRRAVVQSGERPPEQMAAAPTKEHWKDRNARETKEVQDASDWRRLTASVETRRARTSDGDVWWGRMHTDSGLTGADLYRYAVKHLNEPGRQAEEAMHVTQ